MTVLALCVVRGNSNFTQYRLSTSRLRNAFSTVSKYNGTSIISFGILGKTCFIASPILFILVMSHFPFALISQFHALHFFAYQLLLDFVSLLLIVHVLTQAFSSQALIFLVLMLLLSLEILYLSLLLPLLLLFCVLLLLFFSRQSLLLLSPFLTLKPLLAPLLFSNPLSFPAFVFHILVLVSLDLHSLFP